MTRLKKVDMRGVVVTSRSRSAGFDFVSRFFAPAVGVDEDPVTGSAHCCLGPYWGGKLGKASLSAVQVSSRGGVLRVGLKGDRVLIGGQAVTVLRAELVGG
jgi:predicted PhzF superfamily epimerase YddE/YHI9